MQDKKIMSATDNNSKYMLDGFCFRSFCDVTRKTTKFAISPKNARTEKKARKTNRKPKHFILN